MKSLLYYTFIIIITISCGNTKKLKNIKREFPNELVNFISYKNNPLFSGTTENTWDKKIRERGYILKEEDMYKMWYTGYNNESTDVMHLGYATSKDGLIWKRYPENPICSSTWVEDMQVLKHDNVYYMFAEGYNDVAHMLSSKDGIHWKQMGNLDIRKTNGEKISKDPYGTPTVWKENEKWYLFYERNDAGIWLATSTNLKKWINVQDDPVIKKGPENYDKHAVAMNQVIKYKGKYYGYYHASAFDPWKDWSTNVAVSDDLINWRKYPKNPIIGNNKSSGILVHDGKQFRLYTMHSAVELYIQKVK